MVNLCTITILYLLKVNKYLFELLPPYHHIEKEGTFNNL